MLKVKRNVLSVALATAILASSGQVLAQEADKDKTEQEQAEADEAEAETDADDVTVLEAVEVTGIRAAIEQSIETKRGATSIVEAISSEDIGKLPDTSIADSLARLPGLAAQRFGNRPQEINIRGFAGDFSTALLNGREQVSLGNNRGVEFDQYPSELTHQVIVYKTPDAGLVGQGLSGTVDLRTVSPLEYGERVVAMNLRRDVNDLSGEKTRGYRASISYIDQFADDTIGLALGYAHLNNPGQGHDFGSWGYDNGVLQGANVFDVENDNKRDGFMGVLEYKPSDSYSTTLDFFYSRFDKEETRRGFQFSLQSWTGAVLNGRTNGPDGTAIGARFSNVNFGVIRNDFNAAYDDLLAVGWNQEFKFGDAWTMDVDLSHSGAKREERLLETYARLAPGVADNNVVVTFNPDGYYDFDFSLDLTNPANFRLMDPGGWGGDRAQAGYLKDFEVEDELNSLRLDFERSFESGMFSSLDFGANITDRSKSRSSVENTLCITASCVGNTGAAVPAQFITSSDLSFAGITFLGLDPLGLLNNFYFRRIKDHPDINNKNWEINEAVTTLYLKGNLDTDLGSVPLRGNLGLQVVRADQDSTGVATFNGVALGQPSSRGATYTEVLPSLNLSFQFPADQYLRFGAARQMARPRMDDLRANAGYGYDQMQRVFSGGGGNPELKPWLANAYDLSYEKYFQGTQGYVSLAYFHKDLKTYINNQLDQNFDFSVLPIPVAQLPSNPRTFIGNFTKPVNGEGGSIRGWEFALSLPLELLWAPLEGFGFQGNYSDTDSAIPWDGPGTSNPLPGLSKYVSNLTLYYERYGFSARASQRHRSEFLGEVQGFGGDRARINFGGETVTDVQVGYTFQSGALQDLSVLLQVNNLENEPFRTNVDGFATRPNNFSEFGRTFLFGVNYKF